MSEATLKLVPLLDALTSSERQQVREYIDNMDGEMEDLTEDEWLAAWTQECEMRMARVESGESRMIPGEEVMRKLREKYG